jgi:hypothetical protein
MADQRDPMDLDIDDPADADIDDDDLIAIHAMPGTAYRIQNPIRRIHINCVTQSMHALPTLYIYNVSSRSTNKATASRPSEAAPTASNLHRNREA